MRFFKEFLNGIYCYHKAIVFNRTHGLWKYYWLPFALSLLAYLFLAIGFWVLGGSLVNALEHRLAPYLLTEQKWLTWLTWFTKLLLRFLILLFYYKIYRYLMLILLSPALASLAEKVQVILNKKENDGNLKKFIHDFLRGLKISFSALFYELLISFTLMGLSLLFPLLSLVFGICIFLNEAYFVGLAMIDYRNEFEGISVTESQKIAFKRIGFCMGNGLICNLAMFIPFFGVAMPLLSVVAAGIGIEELEKNNQKK